MEALVDSRSCLQLFRAGFTFTCGLAAVCFPALDGGHSDSSMLAPCSVLPAVLNRRIAAVLFPNVSVQFLPQIFDVALLTPSSYNAIIKGNHMTSCARN